MFVQYDTRRMTFLFRYIQSPDASKDFRPGIEKYTASLA
jgi:hypothetical protein